ncbi:MAG: serine protease [Patescibacteria group bacterium]
MNLIAAILNVLGIIALIVVGIFGLTHTALAPTPTSLPTETTTGGEFPIASTTSAKPELTGQKSGLPSSPQETGTRTGDPRTSVPEVPAAPTLSDTDLNTLVRGALVNILCTTISGGAFQPISGSGVVIDSRGVILTNAHVGQFFLLRDYIVKNNITCVIRIGSPAQARYSAELLYLPQQWIDDNAEQIKAEQAKGTGQNDYAFVRITGTTNPAGVLPSSFPALAWSTSPPRVGTRMILASYPAGLLGGDIIATSLYATSAFATVGQLFSFDGGLQVDTFSVGGTIASQAGSSGGAVASTDGNLRGLISTANLGATTGASTLYAISLGHISRSLAAEGQGGIPVLLDGDIVAKAANFNATVAKSEAKKLEAVLDSMH